MIITRFAPSPTGDLHLGGARTALFNLLFARHHGGKMLLRIEDTDRARSTDAAREQVIDALRWLNLQWDDEPMLQHTRAERHREVAHQLLASGKAYRCYATAEELQAMRTEARAAGKTFTYDGRWRDGGANAGLKPPNDDTPFAIRLATEQSGATRVDDIVQGEVRVANQDIDDFIVLRSDGTPTYMLGVVVDDFDMGVSHVIRGDDHLTNAFRQLQIYRAMQWQPPTYAHLPLLHGSDGTKLSKRHGAVSVQQWQRAGYLPQAVLNALVRLGWGHGDQEIFSFQQMVELFDLSAVGRGAARFDNAKLEHLNKHYIKTLPREDILNQLTAHLPQLPRASAKQRAGLVTLLPELTRRASTLLEVAEGASFLFAQLPLKMDAAAAAALAGEGKAIAQAARDTLSAMDDWRADGISEALRSFAKQRNLKLVQVAQPLRAALTGSTRSPGIFEVLAALGKTEALARIDIAVR